MRCPNCEIVEMKMNLFDGEYFNFKCPKCNTDAKMTIAEVEAESNES